jgi:hypothetical protein
MISSNRWLSRSQRTRLPLPCTCSSPPGLGFQFADGGRDASGEDGRVRPLRVGERGRCHVLGPRVQRRCDGARICPYSPVAGKDLVGPPAEQEGVGALVDLGEERLVPVVEERQSEPHPPRSNPPLRSSSGPPRPCITPSTETFVVVVSFMVVGP